MQVNPNTLTGAADGDSGVAVANAAPQVTGAVQSTANPAGSTASPAPNQDTGRAPPSTKTNEPGSWVFSEIESYSPAMSVVKPGRRLKNPLGYLASYTYQLSLYMITSDAYNVFVESGRKNINALLQASSSNQYFTDRSASNQSDIQGGAFLIAQSGGINNTNETRAPGFDYDLVIDDLSFDHLVSARATGSSLFNTNIKFRITEPYGFSFISKLKNANDQINKYNGSKEDVKNPTRQFFILGIRFFGWNQSGEAVKGSDIYDGEQLDPNSTGTALFETFYDMAITHCRFKIDGKSTVYDIEATCVSPSAANIRKGFNQSEKEATGTTVHEVLCGPDGFLTKLNADLAKTAANATPKESPMKYKIKWLGDASDIALADIRSKADTNKASTPASDAKNTTQSNDATAVKAQPNTDSKAIKFPANLPITQLIEETIMKSAFIEDALTVTYTDSTQNDPASKTSPRVTPTSKKVLRWFNISPQISDLVWSKAKNDWTYTITYVIQTYYIPVVDSPYAAEKAKYYGPHKRYDYWYSGLNTEIISYESQLDNAFFATVVESQPSTNAAPANPQTGPVIGTDMQASQIQGAGNSQRTSAVSSFRTSLYDPGAYAMAKVQILGDPDYLMQPSSDSVNGLFNKHYGADGFTVNPTGGQVFFEIDFKEAVDYSSNSVNSTDSNGKGIQGVGGTLSINDSILFWDYPADYTTPDPKTGKPLVQGISYTLYQVKSSFSGGSFKQTLEATINSFGDSSIAAEARDGDAPAQAPANPASNAPAPATPAQDKPVNPPANGGTTPAPTTQAPAQTTTPTGPGGASVQSDA